MKRFLILGLLLSGCGGTVVTPEQTAAETTPAPDRSALPQPGPEVVWTPPAVTTL